MWYCCTHDAGPYKYKTLVCDNSRNACDIGMYTYQNAAVRSIPLADLRVGARSFVPTHPNKTDPATQAPINPSTPAVSMTQDVWCLNTSGVSRRQLPIAQEGRVTNNPQAKVKTSTKCWSSFVQEKGEQIRGYYEKNPREGSFGRPPLAEFGADAARSFADHTTGVSGTGGRSRWAQ